MIALSRHLSLTTLRTAVSSCSVNVLGNLFGIFGAGTTARGLFLIIPSRFSQLQKDLIALV